MSTATIATAMTNNTDANFRAWGSWISDQFAAFGWQLVGSVFATGTDWTDVTAPASANAARVTELWRMDDSHQGSAPLFLLIDYGETSVADCPGIRIRLGTGGSGTSLSGQFYDSSNVFFGANSVNTNSLTHFASGDAGRIGFMFSVSGTSLVAGNQMGFCIERRINSSGASQATGWLFSRWNNSVRHCQAFKNDGTSALATPLTSMGFPIVHSTEANLTFDGKQNIVPAIFGGLGPMEAGLNLVAYPVSGYGAGATFSVTAFGSSHTYVTYGSTFASLSVISGSAANISMAMRYE